MTNKVSKGKIHVVIGDTQAKEGVPLDHHTWIGRYIVDQFAGQDVRVIHVGDHADMPSLSSYDKGKKGMEGRRYKTDIKVANHAFDLLCKPLARYNENRKPDRQWWPDRHLTLGNHENRINVACEVDAQLDGVISTDDLNYKKWGWKVHEFKKVVWLDGIAYCHYFYDPMTGRPYGGKNLHTRLQTIGHSFTMGHQQGLSVASRPVGNSRHCGLVNGSCYLHDEKYLGPQGNNCWRGIVVCHQVEKGAYDRMEVSLEFLCRKYTGKKLSQYMADWTRRNV